jgi:hypothetical protein
VRRGEAHCAGQDRKKKVQLSGGQRVGLEKKNQRKKADQIGLDVRIAGLAGQEGLDTRKKAAAVKRNSADMPKAGIPKVDGRKKKLDIRDGKSNLTYSRILH